MLRRSIFSRHDDPAALVAEGGHPSFVRRVLGELAAERYDLKAIAVEEEVKSLGGPPGDAVVEEEFHAARRTRS